MGWVRPKLSGLARSWCLQPGCWPIWWPDGDLDAPKVGILLRLETADGPGIIFDRGAKSGGIWGVDMRYDGDVIPVLGVVITI